MSHEATPGKGVNGEDDASRTATGTGCGWSVDGVFCAGEAGAEDHAPAPLPRNGFFERVACRYAWTCGAGCCRKARIGKPGGRGRE